MFHLERPHGTTVEDCTHEAEYVTTDTYLRRTMKTKLTLSIERSKVALLRRASARKGASISELVENMAGQEDGQPVPGPANILKWKGYWAKHIDAKEFEADDRGGAELRKTVAYKRLKRKKRK